MRQLTPEQVRIRSHADASAYPATAELRALLSSGASAEQDFWSWLALPYTQRMVRALKEMSDNPAPLQCDAKDAILVQYGITTGLQLAVKLLSEPRRVFPDIFRDPADSANGDLGAYVDDADKVIDTL